MPVTVAHCFINQSISIFNSALMAETIAGSTVEG